MALQPMFISGWKQLSAYGHVEMWDGCKGNFQR